MLVYRLCRIGEVNKILEEKSMQNVGVSGSILIARQQKENVNSHVYSFRKTYLHFFENLPSIFYLYPEDKYLCTYDIPEEVLNKYLGYGFYLDYKNRERVVSTVEYAIPIEEISFKYLQSVDKINEYIDYEDYLFDPTLSDNLENVYQKGRSRIRRKDA